MLVVQNSSSENFRLAAYQEILKNICDFFPAGKGRGPRLSIFDFSFEQNWVIMVLLEYSVGTRLTIGQ